MCEVSAVSNQEPANSKVITLLETITSACKKDVVYGEKGDKVTLISERGNVLLVRDKKGNGFPVRTDRTDYKI